MNFRINHLLEISKFERFSKNSSVFKVIKEMVRKNYDFDWLGKEKILELFHIV